MSNDEKNQKKADTFSTKSLLMKQGSFLLVCLLWGAAILFKKQLVGPWKFVVFVVLVLVTFAEVYWINRSLFKRKD